MGIKKNLLSKRPRPHRLVPKTDETTGEENQRCDERTMCDTPEPDWNKYVRLQTAGHEPVIPVSVVEHIMVENEQLRETLYASQNSHYNRVISTLQNEMVGQSTSNVIKLTAEIEAMTSNVITAQESFRFVYAALEKTYAVDFDKRKARESKLQYAWRIGYLPHVSLMMNALKNLIRGVWGHDITSATKFFKGIAATIELKNQKKYNLPNKSVKKP